MSNVLDEDIKKKSFHTLYLLYGEEDFLRQSYKKQLCQAMTGGDDMNFNTFHGKDISVNEIISLADTLPFFAERRVLLIEDSGFFKKSPEELVKYLPDMPDTTSIVFSETEVDKRSALYKKVKDLGLISEMAKQETGDLAVWAAKYLAHSGKKVTRQTMDEFLMRTGNDMSNIRSELEKLISYVGEKDVVESKDVAAVTTMQVESRIFDLVDALVSGKMSQAMKLYEDLTALKEPPMRILFLITRQFNQLLLVKDLQAGRADRAAIAKAVKVPPFAVRKLEAQAGTFSRKQVLSCVQSAVELEEAVKTGRLSDRMAVELMITRKYKN